MRKTFREVKKDDILYNVGIVPNYNLQLDTDMRCYVYTIYECKVTDAQHITETVHNFGDMWTPDMRKIPCDNYQFTFEHPLNTKNTINFSLGNIDENSIKLYHAENMYVNIEDAKEEADKLNKEQYLNILKYYNKCRDIIDKLSDALLIDNIVKEDTLPIGNAEKVIKAGPRKVALFPGSFNPFTIGHKNIVDKALTVFDKVIIAFGVNSDKDTTDNIQTRMKAVKTAYKDQNVSVIKYDGMTMDIAKKHKATIIRGVRNILDFEYEKSIADVNKKLGNIDTVFFLADSEYGNISSTLVRELEKYGKDISNLII